MPEARPQIFAVSSEATTAAAAAEEIASRVLAAAQGITVRGILFSGSVGYPVQELQPAVAKALPRIPFMGTTSCLGVGIPGRGLVRGNVLSGLALVGDGFRLVTSMAAKTEPLEVGRQLGQRLSEQIPKPKLVLFNSTPGQEEQILGALSSKLPTNTPILGGSAADNDLSGSWYVWTQEGFSRNGVAVAATDWPWRLATNYQAGYLLSDCRGVVTRAEGRTLFEIDGRPAAEVYNEWVKGKLDLELKSGGNVLSKTTLAPLGVPRIIGTGEMYLLAHPERVNPADHSLSLFAEIRKGETVSMMKSSPGALQQRGGNVALRALSWSKLEPAQVLGAYFVYCGGCLLAIADRASAMITEFETAIGQRPYVSHFAFGEQGCVWPNSPADHGNLMASVVLFSAEPELP